MATATRSRAKLVVPTIEVATPAEIMAITQEINTRVLVEREQELRVTTLGALAAKNIHLDGPPGTAKSLGCREFCKRIVGGRIDLTTGEELIGRYFEKAVHPQMPADAIIGAYDMEKLLKESRLERAIEHYLPNADFAFIDEILRANGPTTDALLPILNPAERAYDANGCMKRARIRFIVTAANRLPDPEDANLGAFASRLGTVMCKVSYIQSDDSFIELIHRDQRRRAPEHESKPPTATVTLRAFIGAQEQVRQVDATHQAFTADFVKLRRATAAEGLVVDDRRWMDLLDIVRAAAWIAGRDYCVPEDLAACEHGLWRIHADIPTAKTLVLPYKSTYEQDAVKFREEAEEGLEVHARLRPVIEGTPATEKIEQGTWRELSDAGRDLHEVYGRVTTKITEAQGKQSDAHGLRDLLAELDSWREWRLDNDLPAKW